MARAQIAALFAGFEAILTPAAPGEASSLRLGGKLHRASDDSDLARALGALLAVPPACGPLAIEAHADIPPGGGLGCSAALGVAIARAAERASLGRERLDEARVFERGLAWEGVFHGNPSGIDTAAAASGTFLWFERGVGTRPLCAPIDVWLAVGYSGASASTKLMDESIARIKERNRRCSTSSSAASARTSKTPSWPSTPATGARSAS